LSVDGNGRWCYLAPRVGAMHAVAEAARNVACSGARPLAATNCLNFGNPEKPEVMWQFSEAVDGIAEACGALKVPITGGNVSFYNETLGKSIFPTPTLGVLGVLEDASRALGMAFRAEGDVIVLLDGELAGAPSSATGGEFLSSEYAKTIRGVVAGAPPAVDLAAERRLIDTLVALAGEGVLRSAHDISDGGLAVALAESCFASEGLSAEVSLEGREPAEWALFGERGARAVVSTSPELLARLHTIAAQYQLRAREIGTATRGEFCIQYNSRVVVSAAVESLRDAWASALERALTTR
ncbi:MAG: phosphoribosylformylglycinamidine synthase II, partial [Acidobacteria bacterium]